MSDEIITVRGKVFVNLGVVEFVVTTDFAPEEWIGIQLALPKFESKHGQRTSPGQHRKSPDITGDAAATSSKPHVQ